MMFGYGMGGFGILAMLLIGALVIGLIVWLVTAVSRGVTAPPSQIVGTPPRHSPREIAQSRYARGEISKAEYEDIRSALSSA